LVLRIVAIVQAGRVRRDYGARMGRRDALRVQSIGQRHVLPVMSIGQREALPVRSMAQDQPTFSVFSDVEPGE